MIKRLFIYAAALLVMTACSDDGKYSVEPSGGNDGTITFTITIPEPDKVVSRADKADGPDERAINDLSLLIYGNDGRLLQGEVKRDFTVPAGDDNTTTVTVTLGAEAKAYTGEATVYIIANAASKLTTSPPATVEALRAVTTGATPAPESGFIMSGTAKGRLNSLDLVNGDIVLYRTAAKLTTVNEAAADFTYTGMSLYNYAGNGYVTAGADHYAGSAGTGIYGTGSTKSTGFTSGTVYAWPVENPADAKSSPFVVIQGEYKGASTYYRLDLLAKDDAAGAVKRLDIDPNHWYEILITAVNNIGYPTADEAAANPASNAIETEIHDRMPEVFDMAFDGIRELGVTDVITTTGTGEAILTVKYYSKIEEEMATPPTVIAQDGWITLGEPEISGNDDNPDTPGKKAVYRLTFSPTDELGSLEGKIVSTWHGGLQRVTTVKWERDFDGNAISTVTLTITPTDGSGNKTITDYWKFLSGRGTGIEASGVAPALFGIAPDAMGGKVRNQGFHFPVMYGTDGCWGYSYTVRLTPLKDAVDFSWQVEVDPGSDPAIKNYVIPYKTSGEHKEGLDDVEFTITRSGSASADDYTYGTGRLILTITPKSKDAVKLAPRYQFDLYHTGFFHYDKGLHRKDAGNHSTGYYYYEVLPVKGVTGTRYMLDRNLGATAAGMYIKTATGDAHVGESAGWPFSPGKASAGGYYHVAYDKGTSDYSDPQMYGDLTPPGYRVPQQRVWDAIRNSPNYQAARTTAASVSYFTSCYRSLAVDDCLDRERPVRNELIYFPKVRYIENGNPTGDANAGYYWTQTAAAGTEKDEIGRWLKCLLLSGEVSSYINGRVADSDGGGGNECYAMSVRCINDVPDNDKSNVTSFRVKGATHVFLYKGDVADKEYTTSWPGHPIGNSETADRDFFSFVYESSVYEAADLKVIFNYVDASGKISTISKNGDKSLKEAEGWPASEFLGKDVEVDRTGGTIKY